MLVFSSRWLCGVWSGIGLVVGLLVTGGVAGCASPCSQGTWKSEGQCVAWSDCAPGTYVSAEGTVSSDRVCTACAAGMLTTTINAASCRLPVFTNGQAATVVIGQPDFSSVSANQGLPSPADHTSAGPWANPFVDASGRLFIAEYDNIRVLVFDAIPTVNDEKASLVIGQPDFMTSTWGTSATLLRGPAGAFVHQGKLIVSDSLNQRVVIYDPVPSSNPGTISVVVGQPDAVSSAVTCDDVTLGYFEGAAMAGNRLVVPDTNQNRVLIWNSLPTQDGQPADLVLGQADFGSCSANRGAPAAGADTLRGPTGAWSDGQRLAVVDTVNYRLLIWNTFPTQNGQPADLVLGQPDFSTIAAPNPPTSSSMFAPETGVYFSGEQLFVVDAGNNRVLVWNGFPTMNGQPADAVLGQADFVSSGAGAGATGLNYPGGVLYTDGRLLVTDYSNNRTLVYDAQ